MPLSDEITQRLRETTPPDLHGFARVREQIIDHANAVFGFGNWGYDIKEEGVAIAQVGLPSYYFCHVRVFVHNGLTTSGSASIDTDRYGPGLTAEDHMHARRSAIDLALIDGLRTFGPAFGWDLSKVAKSPQVRAKAAAPPPPAAAPQPSPAAPQAATEAEDNPPEPDTDEPPDDDPFGEPDTSTGNGFVSQTEFALKVAHLRTLRLYNDIVGFYKTTAAETTSRSARAVLNDAANARVAELKGNTVDWSEIERRAGEVVV